MKLIYCFELHLQLWNGNVNWNQIFSKLCLTELWWGEGFTLIEWWKFPMEKIELPERIIHFNIVIGSLQVTSIVAQVQRTYYNLQSLWKELHSQTNTHWLLKSERLTDDNPYWKTVLSATQNILKLQLNQRWLVAQESSLPQGKF